MLGSRTCLGFGFFSLKATGYKNKRYTLKISTCIDQVKLIY